MLHVLIILLSYLVGSIPFGYLIVKTRSGSDIRTTGSGGTGATNVTRNAGKVAGVLTLLLDAAKGAAIVLLARWVLTEDFGINWWVVASALAVIIGHIFPIWLGFRGGKGVATGLGVFLALAPLVVAIAIPVFALVVWMTRYVSLGSITTAALLPILVWLLGLRDDSSDTRAPLLAASIAGAAVIIVTHRSNIARLLRGEENRLKW